MSAALSRMRAGRLCQKTKNAREGIETLLGVPFIFTSVFIIQKTKNAREGIETMFNTSSAAPNTWPENKKCPRGHWGRLTPPVTWLLGIK